MDVVKYVSFKYISYLRRHSCLPRKPQWGFNIRGCSRCWRATSHIRRRYYTSIRFSLYIHGYITWDMVYDGIGVTYALSVVRISCTSFHPWLRSQGNGRHIVYYRSDSHLHFFIDDPILLVVELCHIGYIAFLNKWLGNIQIIFQYELIFPEISAFNQINCLALCYDFINCVYIEDYFRNSY